MEKDLNSAIARFFATRVKPGYRQISRMDSEDWLAKLGLEKRNTAADIASAIGFVLAGAGIGVVVGLLVAPREGSALRRQVADKLRTARNVAGTKIDELRDQGFGSGSIHSQ